MFIFFRVQPLYFPAEYTSRQTQPRHLLALKCWAIVFVNVCKDDMSMCNYPAFIIVNSFRKTFDREDNVLKFILSYLVVVSVMANAFMTKFIVIRKFKHT